MNESELHRDFASAGGSPETSGPDARVGRPAASDRGLRVGDLVEGRYVLGDAIGEGGMGVVFEARHRILGQKVAIKALRSEVSELPGAARRFYEEAKLVSSLGHPHIVDVMDFGTTEAGQHYVVMERLEGEDLANILHREGTLSPRRAVTLAVQCGQALSAAHAKDVVHRDLKPENIFLVDQADGDVFVKLVDFGVAQLGEVTGGCDPFMGGFVCGTPEYMAPEQSESIRCGAAADVFALGVILFECLTGRVPFVGASLQAVAAQRAASSLPTLHEVNPHVRCPTALEAAIRRACESDPRDRFPDMAHMVRALQAALPLP